MKVFTPRRVRENLETPKGATAKTAEGPTSPPSVGFGSGGEGVRGENATPPGRTVPRLAPELELMVRSADAMPSGPVALGPGLLVPDLGRYVLAWAAAYLVGDPEHALARLHEAHRAWTGRGLS